MKILVAGGLGFIGSKVIEKLCVDHDIICVDSKEDYNVLEKSELEKLHKWRTRNWKNKIQLIVSDGMSDDGTRTILKKYMKRNKNMTLIDNPEKIVEVSKNLGEPMVGINIDDLDEAEKLAKRGW